MLSAIYGVEYVTHAIDKDLRRVIPLPIYL